MRTPLLLLLALGLGALAYTLLSDGGGGSELPEADARARTGPREGETFDAPQLEGHGRGRPRPSEPEPAPPPPPAEPAPPGERLLGVLVVDDADGVPLPGARLWFEPSREPCPRLPGDEQLSPPPPESSSRRPLSHATDASGRFELDTDRFARPEAERLDVFAAAPGYVTGVACAVRLPGETTLRLSRGLALQGRVTDLAGRPLAEAVLLARPGPNTTPVPGHAGWALTDAQGRFRLDGLLPGTLTVRAEHPGHFPRTIAGEDPVEPRERVYALAPAFVLRFRVRTDDGRPAENPTVHLRARGQPPVELLELVSFTGEETAEGRLTTPLALPATAPSVSIAVKAEGYAAWTRAEEPVPAEGGERVLAVTLVRDVLQGALALTFEAEGGTPLSYADLRPLPPVVTPLDRQNLSGGVVLEPGEILRFPSLPVGRYRMELRTFAYAPASVEASVSGGAVTEQRVTLRAAARLRVRFTAPTARVVRFRLVQGGTIVPAIPETPVAEAAVPGGEPVLAAGEAGALLGGLASGAYVVEVLSDDLEPSRTPVSVREGEVTEVEVRVVPR